MAEHGILGVGMVWNYTPIILYSIDFENQYEVTNKNRLEEK